MKTNLMSNKFKTTNYKLNDSYMYVSRNEIYILIVKIG